MRTKRTTATKKSASRAAKTVSVAGTPKKIATWIAGIDRLSLGIAAAAIVGAGVLVTAYRAPHSETTQTAAARSAAAIDDSATDSRRSAPAVEKIAMEGPSPSSDAWPAPLTITGCLERDDNAFRLTDASGVGVPKSRSWKSGFLRKKSSTVAVTDRGATNRLAAYVGRRIETTGVLVDREMRIKTLRVLGACD